LFNQHLKRLLQWCDWQGRGANITSLADVKCKERATTWLIFRF